MDVRKKSLLFLAHTPSELHPDKVIQTQPALTRKERPHFSKNGTTSFTLLVTSRRDSGHDLSTSFQRLHSGCRDPIS